MKTIILIGIALAFGLTVKAQGWAAPQGSGDGFAFDPYTMSKMPTNIDGINTSPALLLWVPVHIWPEDDHTGNTPPWRKAPYSHGHQDSFPNDPRVMPNGEPNNDPNLDAVPNIRVATFVVTHHSTH